jgi:D-sedoheptulose 7-phosphate isomerase
MQTFVKDYLAGLSAVLAALSPESIDTMAAHLVDLWQRDGRLFIVGVGGSAANASHAASDFRTLCGIESYALTDNIPELTARINDTGWDDMFVRILGVNRMNGFDALMVLSVGGGSVDPPVSVCLVEAINYAKLVEATVLGIVGRDGGETARRADCCIVIPPASAELVTPYTESVQSVVLHLLATHPRLKRNQTKWESL